MFKNFDAYSAEEARRRLEESFEVPVPPDPAEASDAMLSQASETTDEDHSRAVNIIVLAFVVLFFGSVFLALTNHQDFSEQEGLTFERIVNGSYFSDIQKRFDSSIPLQDYIKNAQSAVYYCFGFGNTAEFIDVESKRLADDPYSIEATDDEYTPVTGVSAYSPELIPEDDDDEPEIVVTTSDNNMNKKLTGISLTTKATRATTTSDDTPSLTTVNRDAPAATVTTTEETRETTTADTTTTPEPATTTTTATTAETTTTTEETAVTTEETTTEETDAPPEENSSDMPDDDSQAE